MPEPYLIRISSQKGGVGKTVVATNLAAAMKANGYKVLLVDADLSNPSIGVYLGVEDVNVGMKEVILGRVDPRRAIIPHYATGIHILPGTISAKEFVPQSAQFEQAILKLKKLNYDFIIIDTQPGAFFPGALKLYNEALIIATPEMASCLSAVKLANICNRYGLKHNLVANRYRNKRYEISVDEMEEIYEHRVAAVVPEDDIVPISLSQHIPAYMLKRSSPFSKTIHKLANLYIGRAQVDDYETEQERRRAPKGDGGGIIGFLKRLFRLQ